MNFSQNIIRDSPYATLGTESISSLAASPALTPNLTQTPSLNAAVAPELSAKQQPESNMILITAAIAIAAVLLLRK